MPPRLSPDLAGQLCDRIAARRRQARYDRAWAPSGTTLSAAHWSRVHARAVAHFLALTEGPRP